jgi:hypothetical protein
LHTSHLTESSCTSCRRLLHTLTQVLHTLSQAPAHPITGSCTHQRRSCIINKRNLLSCVNILYIQQQDPPVRCAGPTFSCTPRGIIKFAVLLNNDPFNRVIAFCSNKLLISCLTAIVDFGRLFDFSKVPSFDSIYSSISSKPIILTPSQLLRSSPLYNWNFHVIFRRLWSVHLKKSIQVFTWKLFNHALPTTFFFFFFFFF